MTPPSGGGTGDAPDRPGGGPEAGRADDDGSADDGWRDRLLRHGGRALLLLLAAASLPMLFPRSPLPRFSHLEEGMVAEEDVIAEVSFPVRKSEERLRQERREAEQGVTPIFRLEPSAADSSVDRALRLFEALDSVAREAGPDTAGMRRVMSRFGVPPSPEQLSWLADDDRRRVLRGNLVEAFRTLLPRGVAPSSELDEVASDRILVRGPRRDRRAVRDSVTTMGDFYEAAAGRAPDELATPGLQLHQALSVRFARPTLRFDRAATRAARQQAREAVETTAGHVLEGERIVAAHERVGAAQMERLRSYREELRRRGVGDREGRLARSLGAGLYGLGLLALLALVTAFFRPEVYRDPVDFGVVVGLTFLVVGASSLVVEAGTPEALVPVAFSALLIAALYDGLLAVVTVGVMAGLLAGQPPFAGAAAPFLAVMGGGAAALGVRWVRRRSDAWMLIAAVGGAYAVGAAALGLMRSLPLEQLAAMAGWGTVNAAASTLFAVGAALPALEKLTGITTEQTLLELCDLNRPLLQRLSREAPGTYAHSINVANLAEAACSAIGADALLARAGTYYHDIGKMARPQFFAENQPAGRNPHDRLPPEKSAEIIRSHVSEGLRMAREARLPEDIRAFIREHHGTMTVVYFLERARERCDDGDPPPDPGAFTYPGPRPRSRETAVVMLADGVESAARTLDDPVPERIRELVEEIVRQRLASGQLEESPLTLRDLSRIRRAFTRVLSGVYHSRVEYPEATAPDAAEDEGGEERPAGAEAAEGVGAAGPGRAGGVSGDEREGDGAGDDGTGDGPDEGPDARDPVRSRGG